MKPDWDKLMDEFDGSPSFGIFDVDCTADGKDLCEKMKVTGYPTIKWGEPNDLQDYQQGRSFDDLKKFATENLGPVCGPKNLDLCDAKTKGKIEGFMALPKAELAQMIAKLDKELTNKEKDWNKRFRKVDSKYQEFLSEMGEESEFSGLQNAKDDAAKAKLSKVELAKYEKKQKQAKQKAEKLEKKKKAMEEQRDKLLQEKGELDAHAKETGSKYMVMVMKMKDAKKEEL